MQHARTDYQARIVDRGIRPIPDDEPVFLLRGQDVYAWRAVLAYADLLKSNPATVERRVADSCRRQAMLMKAWSKTAAGKAPDIPEGVRTILDPEDMFDADLEPTEDEVAIAAGWASGNEFLEAIGGLDLSGEGAQARFESWRDKDGTKAGFAALEAGLSGGKA